MMLPGDLSAAIDAWIARQKAPKPSRPEAIRRLISQALQLVEANGGASAPAPSRRKAAATPGAKAKPIPHAKAAASKRPARRRA
jgi:hypothetical protein